MSLQNHVSLVRFGRRNPAGHIRVGPRMKAAILALMLILAACGGPTSSHAPSSIQPSLGRASTPSTATPSPCPALTLPPSSDWKSFTDPQYSFTISYPPGFAFAPYPRGSLRSTDPVLIAYRAADSCFVFGAETGWASVGVYAKDAETLAAWVQKHSDNRACLGGPGLFVFVINLKTVAVGGRDALSFEQDTTQCGEGSPVIRHTTTFSLHSGDIFVFEWQSADVNYTPTMQAIAETMLASVTG